MRRLSIIWAVLGVTVVSLALHASPAGAQPVASITLPAPGSTKQLYLGCNNIALTFPDGTASQTVVQEVMPAAAVEAFWRHNARLGEFEGFSPQFPQASDLPTVAFLDAVWLCIGDVSEAAAPSFSLAVRSTPTPATGNSPAAAVTPTPAVTTTPTPTAAATATVSPAGTSVKIGVDAYVEHLSQEPGGVSGVYKYVVDRGWQSYVSSYIDAAYDNGLRPFLVFYTNFDSTSPDFVAWDEVMGVIRSDGRDVWVIVEPDLWGYIEQEGQCGSLGRQHVDRFLSTRPTNAHLGFLFNPWNVPYAGASADARNWKNCWLEAGGDRMQDIYVDISDRDQEYYGNYPWPQDRFALYESWFAALHNETGRRVNVWQIPMGNSPCQNSRRSNFVETWLPAEKMSQLSQHVNWLLFGPGVESGSEAQSWNLPSHDKYDCGFFNAMVGG